MVLLEGENLSDKKVSVDELLEKAYKPAEDAMVLHPFYEGKIQTIAKCAIRDFNDFAVWYTPGVA
ncbi:MAG: malate dehydrogenase, partial [Promethearchaeota archaeon]